MSETKNLDSIETKNLIDQLCEEKINLVVDKFQLEIRVLEKKIKSLKKRNCKLKKQNKELKKQCGVSEKKSEKQSKKAKRYKKELRLERYAMGINPFFELDMLVNVPKTCSSKKGKKRQSVPDYIYHSLYAPIQISGRDYCGKRLNKNDDDIIDADYRDV